MKGSQGNGRWNDVLLLKTSIMHQSAGLEKSYIVCTNTSSSNKLNRKGGHYMRDFTVII